MKDKKYLQRIKEYSMKIQRYLGKVITVEEFLSNEEKVDAVLLNLEQIGETSKKLSENFKSVHNNIEWHKIAGLRNLISHDYEGVDLTIIYNIATSNIPALLDELKKVNDK